MPLARRATTQRRSRALAQRTLLGQASNRETALTFKRRLYRRDKINPAMQNDAVSASVLGSGTGLQFSPVQLR